MRDTFGEHKKVNLIVISCDYVSIYDYIKLIGTYILIDRNTLASDIGIMNTCYSLQYTKLIPGDFIRIQNQGASLKFRVDIN